MDRPATKRCSLVGCTLFVLALVAATACSRNQVTSLEPPRNPEPYRSQSPPPHPKQSAAGNSTPTEAMIDAGPNVGRFDFYVLSLSWSPQFCASHQDSRDASECDPSRHYGFVVHGLWPQNDDGTYPVSCTAASPVANDLVRQVLPVMPARGLVQHEWATHGTCSGQSPQQYFSTMQRAFGNVKIPEQYQHSTQTTQVAPKDIEQQFAAANSSPTEAFRVVCSKGDFIGVNVCLTKDLQYRSCGRALRECRAREVIVLPTP